MKLEDFRGDICDIPESKIVDILKGIWYGNIGAVYIGGSLCYTHKVDEHPNGQEDFLFTFIPVDDHNNFSEEIYYWISKIYVRARPENAHYWNAANEAVIKYELKNKEKV